MTTNKPGTVKQQPLYGCTNCYEDWTWPASDLRVYDGECWCDECWGERRYDHPDQPDWGDLEPHTPALQAENEALRQQLNVFLCMSSDDARKARDLRLQAEGVEYAATCFGGRDFAEVRMGLSEIAKYLRDQADEL